MKSKIELVINREHVINEEFRSITAAKKRFRTIMSTYGFKNSDITNMGNNDLKIGSFSSNFLLTLYNKNV